MKEDQSKSLTVNIITGAIVVSLLVAGYFVFLKKDTTVVLDTAEISIVADKTSSIGLDIDSTVQNLKNLSRAVESATVIFDLPAFKNLQDFSVPVPIEGVGKANPFVPAEWKVKLSEAEGVGATGSTGAGEVVVVTPVSAKKEPAPVVVQPVDPIPAPETPSPDTVVAPVAQGM